MNRTFLQLASILILVGFAISVSGQTAGQPTIYTGNGAYTTDPLGTVIDVAVFDSTDTDFCVRVNSAWNYILANTSVSSVTVDARGLTGTQSCTTPATPTPFPTWRYGAAAAG